MSKVGLFCGRVDGVPSSESLFHDVGRDRRTRVETESFDSDFNFVGILSTEDAATPLMEARCQYIPLKKGSNRMQHDLVRAISHIHTYLSSLETPSPCKASRQFPQPASFRSIPLLYPDLIWGVRDGAQPIVVWRPMKGNEAKQIVWFSIKSY